MLFKRCTATITSEYAVTPGITTPCTRRAGRWHGHLHVGPKVPPIGRTVWADHHTGATPHTPTKRG